MTKKDEKGRIVLGDYMKAKDKVKKHIKVSLKNIIIFLASIIIVLYSIIFYNYYFVDYKVYAEEVSGQLENFSISNATPIDMNAIIEENTKNQQKEEYIVEEVELEYITKYQTNTELPKGVIQVIQEGREGKQEITKKKTYENGQVVVEEQINSKVTKASVNKIVEIGAGNSKSSYRVKAGDTVYVTSDRAEVMLEPDENSKKVATLTKQAELKVLVVQNNWYQISGAGATRVY